MGSLFDGKHSSFYYRGVFRASSKIYDGALFAKISIVDVRLGSKYASVMPLSLST